MRILYTAALLGSTFLIAPAHALTITETDDGQTLADALFLNLPNGLVLGNVSLSSASGQTGTYTNASGTYGLPNSGIVLSTGLASDYADGENEFGGGGIIDDDGGPAQEVTAFSAAATEVSAPVAFSVQPFGTQATAAQEELLEPITGASEHYDVVQLDIDFEVGEGISSITFFGAFGSEEFPDFVGEFVDGFGLFVNGTNIAGVQPTGGGANLPVNIDHPDMDQSQTGTELNAMLAPNGNPVLRFDVPVTAGQNTFNILLADADDDSFDTTVYLSSFFAQSSGGGESVTNTGETEFNPILPSNPPDPDTGEFVVVIPEIEAFETVWIDPPVTVGYLYDAGTAEFASITAPSLATVADTDGYIVTVNGQEISLLAGQSLNFLDFFQEGPTAFTLTGINPALGLDPADVTAFPLAVSFTQAFTNLNVTITPLTPEGGVSPIPLPATGLLLGFGLFAFGAARRSRKRG